MSSDWRIVIEGTGPCFSGNVTQDANKLAYDFVAALQAQGHRIDSARFGNVGARENLISPRAAAEYAQLYP